jgi:hypothetical protein
MELAAIGSPSSLLDVGMLSRDFRPLTAALRNRTNGPKRDGPLTEVAAL